MLLSPSSKSRTYTGPRTLGSPPPCREGLMVGVVSCGSRLVHNSHRAKHLGLHDHLGLVPPLIQLEKSGEFGREQKVSNPGRKIPVNGLTSPKGQGNQSGCL